METYNLKSDLKIFYVKTESFPNGIKNAMEILHSKVSGSGKRKTYGISRPEANGAIEYKAGVEESFEGEAKSLNYDTIILRKGMYLSIVIKDYMQRVESISEAFAKITSQPGIDPQGYCVEVYANATDVTCMVRMENQ